MDGINMAGDLALEPWRGVGWLMAGFSGCRGGVSSAFGGKSLNLGWKPEDDDAAVAENRRRFLAVLCGAEDGENGQKLVAVRQVHSDGVQVLRSRTEALETEEGRAVLEGDGMVTDLPGLVLGIQVADCVPVLMADVERRAVGAFHAGWKGTLAGIVGKGVRTLREEYGADPMDILAAIGPSIGPCCYAVGDEVRRAFEGQFEYGAELFEERDGEVFLNLWEANRRQLVDAGVPLESVSVLGECSACARDEAGDRRYFSHRAERGRAGRMMGAIGIRRR